MVSVLVLVHVLALIPILVPLTCLPCRPQGMEIVQTMNSDPGLAVGRCGDQSPSVILVPLDLLTRSASYRQGTPPSTASTSRGRST